MSTSIQPPYTISPPFWQIPYPNAGYEVRTCFIEGLPNTYANPARFPENEQAYISPCPAPVDASLAPLLVVLNRAGFPTSFCCSGLDEDHRGKEMPISGYISFDCSVRVLGRLLPAELCLDGDSVIRSYKVREPRQITNAALAASWAFLLKQINQRYLTNAP